MKNSRGFMSQHTISSTRPAAHECCWSFGRLAFFAERSDYQNGVCPLSGSGEIAHPNRRKTSYCQSVSSGRVDPHAGCLTCCYLGHIDADVRFARKITDKPTPRRGTCGQVKSIALYV